MTTEPLIPDLLPVPGELHFHLRPLKLQKILSSLRWWSNETCNSVTCRGLDCRFPGGSDDNESACNMGDSGSTHGSGISPGEGNGCPLRYSCLESPMDRGAWWATVHGVTKSRTRLTDTSFRLLSWLLEPGLCHECALSWRWPGNSICAFSGVWDWASGVQGGDLERCVGGRWMSHALHTTHFIFFHALNNCNKIHKHISTFVKHTAQWY